MNTKVKVVHLITLLEMGGAQGNTIFTVKNLDKNKFLTHLWTGHGAYWDAFLKKEPDLAGRLRYFPHLSRSLNPFYDVLTLFELWAALKKLKPDILHTHSSKAGILGRLAGWLAGVPVILHTYHGFGFNDEQKPWTQWLFIGLEKLTARLSTALIFVSKANIETARRHTIGNKEQVRLIRSGVSLQALQRRAAETDKQAIRESLDIPIDSRLIVTVGPFKPQKNLDDFIKLVGMVHPLSKKVHGLIIGDGAKRRKLEALVKKLNLTTLVHMPGWRQDIPELLSIADLFVLTSLWEGLPRTLVEAMALGIPCVCYNTDGTADLLQQGGGFLIKKKDLPALAKAVILILEDDTLWSTLSRKARSVITDEFDINKMVKQQEDLYLGLLQERRGKPSQS
ncbi:MAG: glycosyltransferase family 4 protein [Elusimicrobia bacterium]|nr:glycosyltransferase family 4 protein [Candidatus Obscuribacterium magneticum]